MPNLLRKKDQPFFNNADGRRCHNSQKWLLLSTVYLVWPEIGETVIFLTHAGKDICWHSLYELELAWAQAVWGSQVAEDGIGSSQTQILGTGKASKVRNSFPEKELSWSHRFWDHLLRPHHTESMWKMMLWVELYAGLVCWASNIGNWEVRCGRGKRWPRGCLHWARNLS